MAAKAKKLTRKIYLVGAIDDESYLRFSKRLSALERQDSKKPIEIELNSPGGSPYDALAFVARIRASPCTIRITGLGVIASAAVIILAAGHRRVMGTESWVMVHEDSVDLGEVDVATGEREFSHLRRMEHQWNELLERFTKTKRSRWAELHGQTTYLTAKQCLELGLIDEVI